MSAMLQMRVFLKSCVQLRFMVNRRPGPHEDIIGFVEQANNSAPDSDAPTKVLYLDKTGVAAITVGPVNGGK